MSPAVLATYSIRVYKKHGRTPLNPFDFKNGRSLPGEIDVFLKATAGQPSVPGTKEVFYTGSHTVTKAGKRHITYGVVQYAQYGAEYDITHVQARTVDFKQTKNHAREEPFFFYFDFHDDVAHGLMILQRIGGRGIKSTFIRLFQDWFMNRNGRDLTLRYGQEVPERLIEKAITAGVRNLRVTQHKVPADLASKFGLRGYEDDIQEVQVIVKAKKGKLLPMKDRINKVMGGRPVSELISIETVEADVASVKIKLGGRERVMRLTDGRRSVNAYWDVSKDVSEGKDGHADTGDLLAAARSLADDIYEDLEIPQ